ncbi:MAG: nucleotidyltransferase family protein [Eubacterium sp.]|nr:nucleotidyltransferase family protein [Eubacterium sp.]
MNREQKYFLELIKAHLNSTDPPKPESIDFKALFELCELQNMTAIAAVELKKLKQRGDISKEQFSPFNQVLGLTLQNYELRLGAKNTLTEYLNDNGVRHIFVKGAVIRELYPVPQLRTSGDIDVIIDKTELKKVLGGLTELGFETQHRKENELDLRYAKESFEIKSELGGINDRSRAYFENPFDLCDENDGCCCKLSDLNHLTYITCHLLKHFKSGGAGVRQLADIDVMLRNKDIDINDYITLCEKLAFEKSAKVLLKLCKMYFDTPVDFEYGIDDTLYETLENVILGGGVFGYGIGNIGTARLMNTMTSGDTSKASSYKAVLGLFAVNKEFLYHSYEYANKHHYLLPVAYMSRLFDAVFRRGRQNIKHIKSMFTDREIASKMSEMLKELEID